MWETVRTSANEPRRHALVSARYLATLCGLDPTLIETVPENVTYGEAAARAVTKAGAAVTARTTWTADGLHVEGIDLSDGRFIVLI